MCMVFREDLTPTVSGRFDLSFVANALTTKSTTHTARGATLNPIFNHIISLFVRAFALLQVKLLPLTCT
jgi:hypothetical protein